MYEAARPITGRSVHRLCLSCFRTAMCPPLNQMARLAQSVHTSALDLIKATFPSISSGDLECFENEYSVLQAELERRYTACK